MTAPEPYPFDRAAWRRTYRLLARHQGRGVWREAAFRAGLAAASGWAWRRDPPAPPPRDTVVIVGHQRSGTTWLHRMLCCHPDAAAMPLHALLLPADRWQRRLDRPRPAWLDRAQDRLLGGLDPVHRTRLHEPEEDEFLMWVLFRSPMNALDRPWPRGVDPGIDGDELAMRFYAQAVARSVRRTSRRHVGKNPHFSWRVPQLRAVLPGVRVIALWRHPEQAIASRLSLIRAIWRHRGLALDLQPHHVERIVASSIREYLGALDAADLDVRYTDLVADPLATVDRVHDALGLAPFAGPARHELGAHLRTGPSGHRYTLEEFGVAPQRLFEALGVVYDRFGFVAPA